jgi:hypothetical protein
MKKYSRKKEQPISRRKPISLSTTMRLIYKSRLSKSSEQAKPSIIKKFLILHLIKIRRERRREESLQGQELHTLTRLSKLQE